MVDNYIKRGRSNDRIKNGSKEMPVEEIKYDDVECIEFRGYVREKEDCAFVIRGESWNLDGGDVRAMTTEARQ